MLEPDAAASGQCHRRSSVCARSGSRACVVLDYESSRCQKVAHIIWLRRLRAVAQGSQIDHRLCEAVREPARETNVTLISQTFDCFVIDLTACVSIIHMAWCHWCTSSSAAAGCKLTVASLIKPTCAR